MTLQELRALAENAPVGPYTADEDGRHIWQPNAKIGGVAPMLDIRAWGYLTGQGHGALALAPSEATAIQIATGKYFAACSPQTILALIEVAEACEARFQMWTRDTYTRVETALSKLQDQLK